MKHRPVAAGLLLLAVGFALLGRWQLDRAAENRALEEQHRAAERLPMLNAPVARADVPSLRFRLIRLQGRYLDGPQVLLDNRVHEGRAGFEVLTPFQVEGNDLPVLVNRGWVAGTGDRARLPELPIPAAPTTIVGRIDHLPRAAISFDQELPAAGSASLYVLSYPSFEALERVLDTPLHRFQLLLDAESDGALDRDTSPPESLDERNIAYAVQWFGLALTAAVIAIGVVVRGSRGGSGSAS